MKAFVSRILAWLVSPAKEALIKRLVASTASLGLAKEQSVTLAPMHGMFGPVTLSGNSLPVFTAQVFDPALMEFVAMRVEVSLPKRIEYFACTIDLGEVEVKPAYRAPFEALFQSLYTYWPLLPVSHKEPIHVLV